MALVLAGGSYVSLRLQPEGELAAYKKFLLPLGEKLEYGTGNCQKNMTTWCRLGWRRFPLTRMAAIPNFTGSTTTPATGSGRSRQLRPG